MMIIIHRERKVCQKQHSKFMRTLEGWLVAAVFPPVNRGRKRIPFSDVIVRIGDKIHSHEKHTLCFKFSQSECPRLDISQGYLSNTQSKT